MSETIDLHILPRQALTRDEFLEGTPRNSIGLDGVVLGGPFFDESTNHVNFDHHDGVVREATMSTCKQAFFAIKGGLFMGFRQNGKPFAHVYINDPDQDTALAVWELQNHHLLEDVQSIPNINRLISLTDELDITGGSFPRNLREELAEQHGWIFQPYNDLRKSGKLSNADESVMRACIEAVNSRINQYMMNQSGRVQLDGRHEILHESEFGYKIINEIGGNDARYLLFSQGLESFISLVAERPDGRNVWTVGRRSRYIPFPVTELYDVYNQAEGFTRQDGWNGSDIIGGSSRMHGSGLKWEDLRDLTDGHLKRKYGNSR